MLSFFRRLTKTKLGMAIMTILPIGALAGFALGDISNFGSGNIGFGMGSSTLVRVGDQQVSEREMSEAMQRRLQEVRKQKPDADYATIAPDFETILSALVDQRALIAFANKFGFPLSKRLVDAEIAQIPGTKGLNGQFSEQAYQQFLAQQRLSDSEVRQIIAGGLLQRLLLTPVATNARVSVGMASPYASMLLESREGEVAAVPVDAFKAGLNPTDADLQRFYAANRNRYMIPEQRVLRLARIGQEQVAGVTASDQEIAAYYNSNTATYGAKDMRSLSQAVVADQASANAIAAKVKAGASARRGRGKRGGHLAQGPDPRGLCRDRRRQDGGGGLQRADRRRRRPDPVGLRVGRGQGRFGQDGGRQVAGPGAFRNRREAQPRQAQAGDRGRGRQGPERPRRRQ